MAVGNPRGAARATTGSGRSTSVPIAFSQLDHNSRERFSSMHWTHLEGVGGSHMLTLSGVVEVDLEAGHGLLVKERSEWVLEDLKLEIALPRAVVGADQAFRVTRSAPLVTLNGLGGVSTVGWSVHEFHGPLEELLTDSVPITAVIAVFSTGEVLHRIGFTITLTGTIEPRG
jgi:hypothetical protein